MKIALISLDQEWENKEKNLTLCEYYIKEATQKGAVLIIFPEMTLTGFSTNLNLVAEDEKESKSIIDFQNLSKKNNIAIIFGIVTRSGDKGENRSYFVDHKGEILAKYTKIHPFSFAEEDKFLIPGKQLGIVNYNNHTFGLSICYDLRFPELYSALGQKCDVIINIANWPIKRVDHWNTLLKARAIENQIYLVGVNRIGTDGNDLKYEESSVVYNANGENMPFEKSGNMKIVEIDKNWTITFKSKFQTIKDRNINLYKELL